MTLHCLFRAKQVLLLLVTTWLLSGCSPATQNQAEATNSKQTTAYQTLSVEHKLGTTVIEKQPQRVVALDMNEVDFLDQLNVPIVGMPMDFVPHFLSKYKTMSGIQDTGAIVQPNLEKVHAAQPDLILLTSLQANHYQELQTIAPTLHFDVDYRDSDVKHIDVIKQHLLTLGQIFDKQALARDKVAELQAKVDEAKSVTQGRPEKALILLHNNGAFSSFGVHSRYGFVFNALGVKPADSASKTGLHGQPVSSEFIQQTDPDIIYIVDRTAVMENRPALDAERITNPLLRQTRAWQNGRVIVADAEAWYVTAASVTSLELIIDDVIKAYQD